MIKVQIIEMSEGNRDRRVHFIQFGHLSCSKQTKPQLEKKKVIPDLKNKTQIE